MSWPHRKTTTLVVLIVVINACWGISIAHPEKPIVPAVAPNAEKIRLAAPNSTQPSFAFVLDISSSMTERQKLEKLKQSGKLAVALLDGRLQLIAFSSKGKPRPPIVLGDAESRRRAMDQFDKLQSSGGTNYLAATHILENCPPGTQTLWISDGENAVGTEAEVLTSLQNAPGKVFTVGIETTADAQALLDAMAAATGGASLRLGSAEELVKCMLRLVQSLGHYRSYSPKSFDLRFPATEGNVIAIGYDATATLHGQPALPQMLFEHRADLPGGTVRVSRVKLNGETDIRVQIVHRDSPNGRLGTVLRSDQLRAKLTLSFPLGAPVIGGNVRATTEFFDKAGNQIDPRNRRDIIAGYKLEGKTGQVLGKFRGQPSQDAPALTATIPLPQKSGPVTIVQGSRVVTSGGHTFDAYERRTILVQERPRLIATPSVLSEFAEVGRLHVATTLTSSDSQSPIPEKLDVVVNGTKKITLVNVSVANGRANFEFDATSAGDYTGTLSLSDLATLFHPLKIPFRFEISPTVLGPILPDVIDLGALTANDGPMTLPVSIGSMDAIPIPLIITFSDLSNGTNVVPLQAITSTIAPTSDKPVELQLALDIGDVTSGTYTGSATFESRTGAKRKSWRCPVRLTVVDPLITRPIELGPVEPGTIHDATMVIRNTASELRNVAVITNDIPARGGLIELVAPHAIPVLRAKANTNTDIKVSVAPNVTTRGRVEGVVVLRRENGAETHVMVRATIVNQGEAPSPLVVSPARLRLVGDAASLVQFNLTIKFATGVTRNDELTMTATPAVGGDGTVTDSVPEFTWVAGNAITPNTTVRAKGFIVLPSASGAYQCAITVQSMHAGAKKVPVTLKVR